jgi:BirA family biotin operon repressor/biotin-[acetyl-CoA-carboxylase] ligase
MDPKGKIYTILEAADQVVSGASISAELGTSRVSVWKHIKAMVESGIPIVSSPNGYRLSPDPDSLAPWGFGKRRERVHHFPEISSTMDGARELARRGCPDNTVVVAQRQTFGRGRMKRAWRSADGGLYFTVVVRPHIPLMLAGLVNLAAAVDMAGVLAEQYGLDVGLKWPNDILAGEQKLCGILSQMEAEGDQVDYLNIGLGLNVNNAPEKGEPPIASLKTLLGRTVPRREILVGFLDRFEKRMARFDPRSVVEAWRARNVTIGRPVRVQTTNDVHEGMAVDIDPQGGLILRRADGTLVTVIHGDCFHR